MPRLPACCSGSTFWSSLFLLWGIVLWLLSDGPIPTHGGPDLPGLDKILHFGYFLAEQDCFPLPSTCPAAIEPAFPGDAW